MTEDARKRVAKMDDNNDIVKKIEQNKIRVKAFFDNKIQVHINLRDGTWLNGEIIDVDKKNKSDFFLINERKRGKLPVFYMDIFDIDKLEPRDSSLGNVTNPGRDSNPSKDFSTTKTEGGKDDSM